MKRILLAVGLLLAALPAQAQTVAPSAETFLGPTVGMQWVPAFSMVFGLRTVTGTTDTVLATDMGKVITYNNGSSIAVTLPQAGTTGFEANKQFCLTDIGAGTATVTPTTSTINGASSKAYAQNARGCIVSDGTNYVAY